MLENREQINCAFGTHNVRSIAACMVTAEKLGIAAKRSFEFQMLHGMAEPIKRRWCRWAGACGIIVRWAKCCRA